MEGIRPDPDKDMLVQLVLSLVLGVSAFVTFCILRPRWPSLYAARERRLDPSVGLPELSQSFLGWIPQLWRVTEEQVLASAGLDAFVFLSFFKMAIRLFAVFFFVALTILFPINKHFRGFDPSPIFKKPGSEQSYFTFLGSSQSTFNDIEVYKNHDKEEHESHAYLWAYVLFTYLFVALTLYSINWETFRIIRYRQDYLGKQSTVTDRTFRLTGIPAELRSEEKIKSLIEDMDLGKVEAVTLCRNWKDLDRLVETRDQVLRRLEASWAKFLKQQRNGKSKDIVRRPSPSENDLLAPDEDNLEAAENGRLLAADENDPNLSDDRPQVTIRYGTLGLRSRRLDAIDYYEERLRRLDAKVAEARSKTYPTTDMALVTMDSVASCQMFIQARIDPRPGRLLTKAAPSPPDLVWKNTYALRGIRRLKSWGITVFITVLTVLWIFPTIFLASFLNICAIDKAAPSFADWLGEHPTIKSLVQTGLPTLFVSLLNVAVPYLYDYLSNHQGMISQGDVELSSISKNFFFTFFNTFFVFAISKAGSDFLIRLKDFLKDTSSIPRIISEDVEYLSVFFIGFIMLQGIGLMPFRILEAGSVCLYPFYRMMSSTPRDFAEMKKPPVFQYGFYLPTSLLVFNLCIIYSVLSWGFLILLFGTIYFILGYFTFKYMVLYAMDQPQHATGGAWRIICYRIVIGLLVFEVVMFGQIATLAARAVKLGEITALTALVESGAILPLIPFTIWYSYYYKRRFDPLTRHIALRAIEDDAASDEEAIGDDFEIERGPGVSRSLLRRGSTMDEDREKGMLFINPSLVMPLPAPWIYKDPPPVQPENETQSEGDESGRGITPLFPNADSSLGIGENNVWVDTWDDLLNFPTPEATLDATMLAVAQIDDLKLQMDPGCTTTRPSMVSDSDSNGYRRVARLIRSGSFAECQGITVELRD
ncbi:Calcium permeable stress-gated cation channel 1 [Paramyrothecium foliicola]|nr:Calcium permeable stress-gated cation channel 1 [Paramyrothecium foliicola]